MEDLTDFSIARRYAVVTGANKGIGLEICRQLASNGITVILTARDGKRGNEAVQSLKKVSGISNVVFHQLDVKDPVSIASLAKFIDTQFKKLDVLVNNAGMNGSIIDYEAYRAFKHGGGMVTDDNFHSLNNIVNHTYEGAEECLQTNYYGTKRVTEALLPLLQLSNSARIVNISSVHGQLRWIQNSKVRSELENVSSLTEERIDEMLMQFLKDFKEDKLQANGWPIANSAYKVSKVAVSAYTRILAGNLPNILVNCVHPGYVTTDFTCNLGNLTAEEGAKAPVMLALLPGNGPSGSYFDQMSESTF